MRNILYVFTTLLLAISMVNGDGVPVAPISPILLDTGEQIFRLRNQQIEIIVSPAADGIVSLRQLDGKNLLSGPVTLLPYPRDLMEMTLPVLEGETLPRWQARAWVTSENWQVVMMTQTFASPVNMRINHVITLPEDRRAFQWQTRITSLAPSEIPATPVLIWPGALQADGQWRTAHAGEETLCETWAPLRPTPVPFPTPRLASLSETGLLQKWESRWRIEDGTRLTPRLRLLEPEEGSDDVPAYHWKTELPETLPPQGWTLVHDLKWSLRPSTAKEEICTFLTP